MKLISDFEDYYDSAFTGTGPVFVRREGLPRRQQLEILRRTGWMTPRDGFVRDVAGDLMRQGLEEFLVVVYLDEIAHGVDMMGKDLLTPARALELYPEHWCTAFLPAIDRVTGCVYSKTILTIGNRRWALLYRNHVPLFPHGAWQSNAGDFDVVVEMEMPSGYDQFLRYPISAIDWVPAARGPNEQPMPYAFDLNSAPLLMGTGIEGILSQQEVADLIGGAIEHYGLEADDEPGEDVDGE